MSAILYDARNNEFVGALDAITGQTVADARAATVVLGALNAEAIVDLNGQCAVNVDVRTAAASLTLSFEVTIDGVNYIALPIFDWALEAYVATIVLTTTSAKNYIGSVTGFRRFRVRVSAYTSGNVTIALRASRADYLIGVKPMPTNLWVTATAAVNTASTLTLPAPGVGLYHYITSINLVKLYAVIGVAAATGVIITSTNLPGNPAWTTEQLASAAGTAIQVINNTFGGNPLKSLVTNTATTLVAPLQLQTIWRWNVSYYIGA